MTTTLCENNEAVVPVVCRRASLVILVLACETRHCMYMLPHELAVNASNVEPQW
ncbi:uncharacterized protein B0H18DRAFT_999120 [Fomitopsis serialis]|uniref:uncharacterized protein n=1 Tax=Fomitopsis serialis TaxID=139415 RepID=UPI0020088261|nr:uncharacterized protein B0H18DRAFT_999120 [Neoantrodia serialis]KAH9928874.1 hypothetical protein B0H18DRAFT_999120 [Neoantrodia serialis]